MGRPLGIPAFEEEVQKPVVIHDGLFSFRRPVVQELPSSADLENIGVALRRYGQPNITGAVLGTLVRTAAPDLDVRAAVDMPIGTGALSKFADQFLCHLLRRVGQTGKEGTGGDNIYECIENKPAAGAIEPTMVGAEQDYWNAFVRPSDNRALYLHKEGDRHFLSFSQSTSAQGVVIEKVSQDEFKLISSDFIELLQSRTETAELATSLRQCQGYANFVAFLKAGGDAYFLEWSRHRREKLREIFLTRLAALDVSVTNRQQLLNILDRSQEAARQEAKLKAVAQVGDNRAYSPHVSPKSLQQAKEFLKAAVDCMSTQEIRALSVPFGSIMDALQLLRERK